LSHPVNASLGGKEIILQGFADGISLSRYAVKGGGNVIDQFENSLNTVFTCHRTSPPLPFAFRKALQ
jgi:hypothetical protein